MQIGSTNTSTINIGVSGDTVNIPSGVTIANAGTATGFGGNNTPAFAATMTGNMNVAEETYHKIQFNTEVLDTDGCYDHSTNYRFTPTTAGKYLITLSNSIEKIGSASNMIYAYSQIHKNGSVVYTTYSDTSANHGYALQGTVSGIVDMNGTSDYVEAYAFGNTNDSSNINILGGVYSNFTGIKVIT
jgi:hypothetical protein